MSANIQPVPGESPDQAGVPNAPLLRQPPIFYVRAGFFAALGVVGTAILAYFAWRLGLAVLNVIAPFALAGVLALLLDPWVDRLEARGWSRLAGVCAIFGAFLLVLVIAALYLVPVIAAQASQLATDGPTYIKKWTDSINDFLESHRRIGTVQLPQDFNALSRQLSERFSASFQGIMGRVGGWLLGSFQFMIEAFVALIGTFYLLMDIDRLRARMYYFAPERVREPLAHYSSEVGAVFSGYLRGLVLVSALYGITTTVAFYGLGFAQPDMRRYALLLGAVAGVLYAVPYIGAAATAIIAGVIGLMVAGPGFAMITAGVILVLNQVFDNGVTPRVVGGGVGLHPMLTLFALVLGGELFGLLGLIISVPAAASIQVVLFGLFPKLKSPTPEEYLRAQQPHLEEAADA